MQSNKVLQKLVQAEQKSNKGMANGYVPLDENAKIPITYIPEGVDTGGGDHTHDEYALKEHAHDNYSPIDHTHDEYAELEHEHDNYSLKEETYSRTEVDELLENIETTPKDHVHEEYVAKDTVASKETLGLVKIGNGLHIDSEGVLQCVNTGSSNDSTGSENIVFLITEQDWNLNEEREIYEFSFTHELDSLSLIFDFYDNKEIRVLDVGIVLVDKSTIKIQRYSNLDLKVVINSSQKVGSKNGGKLTTTSKSLSITEEMWERLEGEYSFTWLHNEGTNKITITGIDSLTGDGLTLAFTVIDENTVLVYCYEPKDIELLLIGYKESSVNTGGGATGNVIPPKELNFISLESKIEVIDEQDKTTVYLMDRDSEGNLIKITNLNSSKELVINWR